MNKHKSILIRKLAHIMCEKDITEPIRSNGTYRWPDYSFRWCLAAVKRAYKAGKLDAFRDWWINEGR